MEGRERRREDRKLWKEARGTRTERSCQGQTSWGQSLCLEAGGQHPPGLPIDVTIPERRRCLYLQQIRHFYPRHLDAVNGGPAQSPRDSQLAEQLTATSPTGDTCAEPSSRTKPHNYLQLPANSIHLNDKISRRSRPLLGLLQAASHRHLGGAPCPADISGFLPITEAQTKHPGRRHPSPKKLQLQLPPASQPVS